MQIVTNKKIKMPIPVIIKKRATGPPPNLFPVQPRLPGHIRKRSIPVVTKQNVMPPEAAKKVIPPIIVIVAHANTGLPPCNFQPGLLRDIREATIPIIPI